MKLSYSAYDVTVTIQTKHDDVTIDEFWGHLRTLCLGAGYAPETVREYFDEVPELSWGPRSGGYGQKDSRVDAIGVFVDDETPDERTERSPIIAAEDCGEVGDAGQCGDRSVNPYSEFHQSGA